ncbi:MAG: diguanylate cyclase, partial [Deltaproteobacteria bacterium]|nr:diguanylate cyclase [Deltaproteobacteria bacterium]
MTKKVYRVELGFWRFYLPIGIKTLIAFLIVISTLAGGFYYYTTGTLSRQIENETLDNLHSKLKGGWRIYYSRMDQMKDGMLQTASEEHVKTAIAGRDSRFLQNLLNGYAIARPYVDIWAVVDEKQQVIGRKNGRTGDFLEIGGVVSRALRMGEALQSTEKVGKEILTMESASLASKVDSYGIMQVVVVPVIKDGKVRGAFVTSILLNGYDWLPNDIYENFSINSAIFGSILNESRIIASTSIPKSIFSPRVMVSDDIKNALAEDRGFKGKAVLEGVEVYLVAEPILDAAGEVIGSLAVAMYGSEVGYQIARINNTITALTFTGIVFSVFLAFFVYRDTVRPINALTAAMDETATGNPDVRVDLKTRDEYERIGEGFNHMMDAIQIREERLARFNELSKLLITSLDPATLLKMALTKMVELTDSHLGIVYLHDEEGGILNPSVSHGVGEKEMRPLKVGEGLPGICALEKKTVILRDIPETGLLLEAGFAKVTPMEVVWFAMHYKERVLGVLAIGSLRPHNEEELRHMEYLVAQVSIALDNALVHQEVERLSITDPLTGLYNRRYFFGRLTAEFSKSKRYNQPLSAVILDIDNFKMINDSMGHQVGDVVLKEIGLILREQTREADIWARYGGEEFIGYLPHCEKTEAVQSA